MHTNGSSDSWPSGLGDGDSSIRFRSIPSSRRSEADSGPRLCHEINTFNSLFVSFNNDFKLSLFTLFVAHVVYNLYKL